MYPVVMVAGNAAKDFGLGFESECLEPRVRVRSYAGKYGQ
jgi:hypothetical protein